jgi:nucleoside-diphosphate-sugar epimerase
MILITGHQGFIGSNLTQYLIDKNYEVTRLDLKSGNDILTCDLPECDLVIHLAGIGGVRESLADPAKYWRNNVEGTRRILEHYQDVRVLVASSSSQYEPHLNPYAASKHVIEFIPHDNCVFMRFHTVYGPTPRSGMFFDKLINGTLEYVTEHSRDFVHVDDVCRAIEILINCDYTGPIDIGTGQSIKISDICPNLPIKKDTTGERIITCADTSNMTSLGWSLKNRVDNFISQNKIKQFKGIVTSGYGSSSDWMPRTLPNLYPGTLNLKVIGKKPKYNYHSIVKDLSYNRNVKLTKCKINGADAFIVLSPLVKEKKSFAEIAATFNLRSRFNLIDGDIVTIEIHDDK